MSKLEKLNILPNGQWNLVKNWGDDHIESAASWIETGMREHLDKLPAAKGKMKNDMLKLLGDHTESRVNPKTSSKEYKLYRTSAHDDNKHETDISSWTSHPDFADYWAHINTSDDPRDGMKPNKITHAWIPEHHIHSYLSHHGETLGTDEREVLVHPHKVDIEHVEHGDELATRVANKYKE